MGSVQWSCLLPTENGAFFLKYVMTTAFVSNAVQITCISELALYVINYYFISRNVAEYMTARQATKFQFPFGYYYPIFLLNFTLVVIFSIACPLIAPAGKSTTVKLNSVLIILFSFETQVCFI